MLEVSPASTQAQNKPAIAGDYLGALGPLHLRLHLKVDAAGGITGTIDSPDQSANGIPCTDFHFDGQALTFSTPAVNGSWKGTVSADGKTLTGNWTQRKPLPMVFTRDSLVPAIKSSRIDGIWLGTLQVEGLSRRIQLHVKSDNTGQEFCSLDSLDEGIQAMGLECAKVTFKGDDFSFDALAATLHYTAKLSADGNTLVGTMVNKGNSLLLTMSRQASELGLSYDPAMAPVHAEDMQSVLNRDLAVALKSGELAPSTGAGVTIAVLDHGVRRIFSYGVAKPESLFEIGSITKTFTGLILSQMVEQGKVRFDEPVRELLPPGTVPKPGGAEITLLDLATQHSGLPRMPDNFKPADGENLYADYHAANLYEYLAKHGVAKPDKPEFLYSNLGFGLLGHAMSVRAVKPYPALLAEEVLDPLGMHDTSITLNPEQQARFLPGHTGNHRPAHAWDFDAFAGAGAIRSTASDMLTYLEANLHPENIKTQNGSPAEKTIAAAIVQSHELRADVLAGGPRIGLAWIFDPKSGNYWHNGGTGGYSAYAFFNPKGDYAAVVLLNISQSGKPGMLMDRIGEHISERLAGKPAIPLGN